MDRVRFSGRSYGWKSTGLVNSPAQLIRRLLNLCGGFVPTTNSYSTAAISSILPYVVGERLPVSTSWDEVLKHSDFVVFIGCDPITTNQSGLVYNIESRDDISVGFKDFWHSFRFN